MRVRIAAVFSLGLMAGVLNAQLAQPAAPMGDAEQHLKRAFGERADELRRPLRIWIESRRIVIAADKLSELNDNRVRLTNVSIAQINDDNAVAAMMRGVSATLIVDRAGAAATDLASFKILSIEVSITPDFATTFALTEPRKRMRVPLMVHPDQSHVPLILQTTEQPRQFQRQPPLKQGDDIVIAQLIGDASGRFTIQQQPRFGFKIDALAKIETLLPTPPKKPAPLPHWTNENLAKVPEITIGEPIAKTLERNKAMEETAHMLAKINYLNAKKTDGFLHALLEQRADLRGLPMAMGDDCRTNAEQSRVFRQAADGVNRFVGALRGSGTNIQRPVVSMQLDQIWTSNLKPIQAKEELVHRATVAALMQILMPEADPFRYALAKFLPTIPHADATKALARLALFSAEDDIRTAAIEGLKTRRERDYTAILLEGFQHPLPAVSKRAAEALVKLERNDLLRDFVYVLDRPDPRLPFTQKHDGKDVTTVREMVRVNHHRNCALCHAPGNTGNVPDGVLTVAVPLPGEPLPQPQQGGYQSMPSPSPDIVVRLDMTYLRQDFSLMLPVADAQPWPEMQRFDFLVRTRVLTSAEAKAYEQAVEPGRLPPNHRAALYALRELTGRDTEPTAAAWRTLLNLPTRQ